MGVEKGGASQEPPTSQQQQAAVLESLPQYCGVNKVQTVLEHVLVTESSANATAAASAAAAASAKGRDVNPKKQPQYPLGEVSADSAVVSQLRARLVQSAPLASAAKALEATRGASIESIRVSEVFGSSCFPTIEENVPMEGENETSDGAPPRTKPPVEKFIGLSVALFTVGGTFRASGSLPVSGNNLTAYYQQKKEEGRAVASPNQESNEKPSKSSDKNKDANDSADVAHERVKSGSNGARAQTFLHIETALSAVLLGQPLTDIVQLDAKLQSAIPGEGLNLGGGVLQQRVALAASLALWKLAAQSVKSPLHKVLSSRLVEPLYKQQVEEFHKKNGTTPPTNEKRARRAGAAATKLVLPGVCMALNDEWFIVPQTANSFQRGGASLEILVEACSTMHRSLRSCLDLRCLFSGPLGLDIPKESENGIVETETVKEALGMLLQSPQLGSISRRSSKHRHNTDRRYIVGDGTQLILHEMQWAWGCPPESEAPPQKPSDIPPPEVGAVSGIPVINENGDGVIPPLAPAFQVDPKNNKGDVTATALNPTDTRPVLLKAPFVEGPMPETTSLTSGASLEAQQTMDVGSMKAPPPLQSASTKAFKDAAMKWKKDGGANFTPLVALLPSSPNGVPGASSVSSFVYLLFSLACVDGGNVVKKLLMDLRPSEVLVRPSDSSVDAESPDVALQLAVALANIPQFPSTSAVGTQSGAASVRTMSRKAQDCLVPSVVVGPPLGDQSQRYNSLLRLSEETRSSYRHYETMSLVEGFSK